MPTVRPLKYKKKNNTSLQDESQPITYNGVVVNTYLEFLPLIKLDSFETVVQRGLDEKAARDLEMPIGERLPADPQIDEDYLALVNKSRPYGQQFKQSLGDKLLFLRRIDRLQYDVIEEAQRKKKEILQEEIKQIRWLIINVSF